MARSLCLPDSRSSIRSIASNAGRTVNTGNREGRKKKGEAGHFVQGRRWRAKSPWAHDADRTLFVGINRNTSKDRIPVRIMGARG